MIAIKNLINQQYIHQKCAKLKHQYLCILWHHFHGCYQQALCCSAASPAATITACAAVFHLTGWRGERCLLWWHVGRLLVHTSCSKNTCGCCFSYHPSIATCKTNLHFLLLTRWSMDWFGRCVLLKYQQSRKYVFFVHLILKLDSFCEGLLMIREVFSQWWSAEHIKTKMRNQREIFI